MPRQPWTEPGWREPLGQPLGFKQQKVCYSWRALFGPPHRVGGTNPHMEVAMEGRRRLILKGAALVAAGAATQVINAPNVIAQPKFQWRMSTTWTPALDVLQGGAQRLGGKIVTAAGGTVVLTPGGEIYTALERGTIDACEWVGPHDDMKLGLHNAAKYYYYPGWHEPGTTGEFGFNKKAYDSLPADLKAILDYACQSAQVVGRMEYEYKK